jgi:hypothetical protein
LAVLHGLVSRSFGEVRLGLQDDVIFQTVIGYDANAHPIQPALGAGVAPVFMALAVKTVLATFSPVVGGFQIAR